MRDGRPGWAIAAASLLGWATLAAPSLAQGPVFADNPQAPPPPEFLSPGKGPGPNFPNPGKAPPTSPFVLSSDGEPNGFSDDAMPAPSPPLTMWIRGDWLLWRLKSDPTNTILVTSSNNVNDPFPGALGQPGTTVLFGPNDFNQGLSQGGRITGGMMADFCPPGELSGFWINDDTTFFNQSSDGSANSPVLVRPVNVAQLGVERGYASGDPGFFAGSINISRQLSLWGIEGNMFLPIASSDVFSIEGILGTRFQQFEDDLVIQSTAALVNPNVGASFNGGVIGIGTSTLVEDAFRTRNRFLGGQLGIRSMLATERFALFIDAKMALGTTEQRLSIAGSSSLTTATTPFRGGNTVPGGILAVDSNSGTFNNNEFTIIPEIAANVGFQLHRSVRLFAGCNAFYWSSVVRPARQLNNVIDTRQVPTDDAFTPGVARSQPPPVFNRSSFGGVGLNVGILIGF